MKHAVADWKADMISMSFGFPICNIDGYDDLEREIEDAKSKGVLLFAAASNFGGQRGPAYLAHEEEVVCVRSANVNGVLSDFSPPARMGDDNLAPVGEAVGSA